MENWNICPFKFNHLPETQIRKEWLRWKRNFEVIAAVSEEKNATKLRNILLAKGGLELQDLFYSIEGADVQEDIAKKIDPYKTAIDKLDDHFSPKQHDSFERNEFCKLAPGTDGLREPLTKFLMRCTEQAKKCDFGKTAEESRDFRIIDKIIYYAPTELREKLLHEEALTLPQVTRMVNSFESIKHQVQVIAGNGNSPGNFFEPDSKGSVNRLSGNSKFGSGSCYRCGQKTHYGNDRQCPARSKQCEKCSKFGHFARVCRSVTKRKNDENSSFSTRKRPKLDNVRAIISSNGEDREKSQSFICNIGDGDENLWAEVGNVLIQMLIDSGSCKNIIDDTTWKSMLAQGVQCWQPSKVPNTVLRGYGRDAKPLVVSHVFESVITVGDGGNRKQETAIFYVIEGGSQPLLGKDTAKRLGVLKIGLNAVDTSINEIVPVAGRPFPKMKNVRLKIPVNSDVPPVAQRVRRPPIALLTRIEEKLEQLLVSDIIEPISGTAAWVSPLVIIVKDNGDLRLCVDMRRANQAIIRERHMMPTFESFLPRLKSAKFFSRLDIKDAFHQVNLR
ncbi:uncharacterized protein LOC134224184 [Armigeres subalbatus]|uniref:uncharacterized protein LOC134224184 n=1 Tax=Armigeres subalbatus TaxID=124917 RepID=UPI002ED3517C